MSLASTTVEKKLQFIAPLACDTEVQNSYENNKALEVHHDMYSMGDFVEMEKRAIVSVDTPKGGRYLSDVTRREIVPVEQDCGLGERNKKPFDWLQIV
ncbi:hypothetical protein RYX36_027734 [Vicia faba]